MNTNLAIITGRLTADPVAKALPTGTTVTTFSLATNRNYTTKDNVKKEEVEYHNVVVFGRVADNCAKFLIRGQLASIQGRLQTRSWESDDGHKNYRTEIVADKVDFGPKPSGTQPTADEPASTTANPYPYPDENIDPEDIPF